MWFLAKLIERMAVLLAMTFLVSCVENKSEIPTKKDIANWYPEFYFESAPIKGVYIDVDADNLIFYYKVDKKNKLTLISNINKSANQFGWEKNHQEIVGKVSTMRLSRIDDESHRYKNWHSLELVQIVICKDKIIFGGVQFDYDSYDSLQNVSVTEEFDTSFFDVLRNKGKEFCQISG
ncbi:MAG: hypothetical protein GY816_09550 [Cytophagales bacterium]|nr:hypothetical protein [Cytophagales bacterium]